MPFVTEKIYKELYNNDESIMISTYPEYSKDLEFKDEEQAIEELKEVITGIRNARAKMNVHPSKKSKLIFVTKEYADMLKMQLAKGNNGLVKTKYITFGIKAENLKMAKARLEKVEAGILSNFKVLGAAAKSLNGVERLKILHDVLKVDHVPGKFPHAVSVHNSCHGVRELGLSSPSERNVQPFNKIIDLLNMVDGITIHEPERKDECCGFGGMFSIEEPAVSTRMGEDKIRRHMATGAEYVTGPDSSCLMHMAGIAKKEKMPIQFIHVVQILAAGL